MRCAFLFLINQLSFYVSVNLDYKFPEPDCNTLYTYDIFTIKNIEKWRIPLGDEIENISLLLIIGQIYYYILKRWIIFSSRNF